MSAMAVCTTSDEFVRRVRLAVGADSVVVITADSTVDRREDGAYPGHSPARIVAELAARGLPDLVVFGPGVPTGAALEVATHLDERHLPTAVVLANGVGSDQWLTAMRAGVKDVLPPDADVGDIRSVLERTAAVAVARRQAGDTEVGRPRGRVIPVGSPKGGCGKTTVATNLAVGLAKLAPHQTVIVDLDLQFGDVATALQLAPEQGIAEAAQVRDLDAMGLKTFLKPHPTGLYSLCAPESPAAADAISGEQVGRLLDFLATEFRYVVVDTAPGLTEHTLAVLDQATDAVLMCSMDVPSIRGLYKELEILQELSLTRMHRQILLNFADRHSGLTVKDVEEVLGTPVDLVLPRSRAVPLSTNRGVPLLQGRPRDPVSKGLQTLVGRFQPQLRKAVGRAPKHRAVAR
ncbi:AAA family ATPase [Nakamurella endophytica]|uniref:CobQ/CobB/MinD/ParA nucleotide binding domain-containing protein n=1 Tax=Nakamurella endophytica TaxID=1748367 RepID=A0A917SM99_9ACTN|nr:AAA family ATPase [Nakamurella endophytica]GGL88905.1 hypothetical protein GCM10011594_05720 [Nakamurella endophytica]